MPKMMEPLQSQPIILTTLTKVVLSSLKQNNIDTTTHHISSIQTVEGPRSIEYTIVLGDLAGAPTKEVTIVQNK